MILLTPIYGSGEGLRWGLVTVCSVMVVGGVFMLRAARHIMAANGRSAATGLRSLCRCCAARGPLDQHMRELIYIQTDPAPVSSPPDGCAPTPWRTVRLAKLHRGSGTATCRGAGRADGMDRGTVPLYEARVSTGQSIAHRLANVPCAPGEAGRDDSRAGHRHDGCRHPSNPPDVWPAGLYACLDGAARRHKCPRRARAMTVLDDKVFVGDSR